MTIQWSTGHALNEAQRHEKGKMGKKLLLTIIYLLAAYGLFRLYQDGATFMAIDDCLDRSGAWNYQHAYCDVESRK